MKLSERTHGVLNSFRNIWDNIIIEPGSEIRIADKMKSIIARATVEDVFPHQVPLASLSEFMSVVGLIGPEADFDFKKDHVVISEGRYRQKYRYSRPDILEPHVKNVPPPVDYMFEFALKKDDLATVKKALTVNSAEQVVLLSEGGVFSVCACSVEDSNGKIMDSVPQFSVSYDEKPDRDFKVIMSADVFKLAGQDYEVGIHWSQRGKLVHAYGNKIDYWLAIDPQSEMGS